MTGQLEIPMPNPLECEFEPCKNNLFVVQDCDHGIKQWCPAHMECADHAEEVNGDT